MRWILAPCLLACSATEPVVTVAPGEFNLGLRWVFIDGDGSRSVAEEEDRRSRLTLLLSMTAGRIVGWQDAVVQVRTDAGEDLSAPAATWASDSTPVLTITANVKPYRQLAQIRGRIVVRHVAGDPVPWRTTLDRLPVGTALSVPDAAGATLTLERRDPGSLSLKLNRDAALCLGEISANDAGGAEVPIRNRRRDVLTDGLRLVLNFDTAKAQTLLLPRWLSVAKTEIPVALAAVPLGLTVPGLADLRGCRPRGADGF